MNDDEINVASPEQRLDRVNGRLAGIRGIAPHLQYSAKYWATHLDLSLTSKIGPSQVTTSLLTQFIRSPKFAYWLENCGFLPRDPIPGQILCAGRYFGHVAKVSVLENHVFC